MKKGSLIFNIILSIAVIILFGLVLTQEENSTPESASQTNDTLTSASGLSLVYVNTDSILLNYEFAKHMNEELMKKEENSRADYNEKARNFQRDVNEFQRKVQNNAFLSLDRAQQEKERLAKLEAELQDLNSRLSNQLMMEQNNVSKQLRDTLENYLKEIQKDYGFTIVLSNSMGDNILYSESGLDITSAVVKGLNARYKPSK